MLKDISTVNYKKDVQKNIKGLIEELIYKPLDAVIVSGLQHQSNLAAAMKDINKHLSILEKFSQELLAMSVRGSTREEVTCYGLVKYHNKTAIPRFMPSLETIFSILS